MSFFDKFKKNKTSAEKPAYNKNDRYILEHRLLPNWILGKDGADVIFSIIEQQGVFFTELYKTINEDNHNYVCPYSPEDFKIQGFKLDENNDGKLVLLIQMPKPEIAPLCISVYIVHNEHLENRRYITIELSCSGDLLICEWKNNSHSILCEYSEDELYKILTK